MQLHRLASLALAAALALPAGCGSGEPGPATVPDNAPHGPTVAREDVGAVITFVNPGRTVERITTQYRRFLRGFDAQGGGIALPAADAVHDIVRMGIRNAVFREVLLVPGDVAIDLAAPALAAALLPRIGSPSFAATVPILSDGTSPNGPRPQSQGFAGLTIVPVGADRLALGYFDGPPADLTTIEGLGAPTEDDFVLEGWGVPAAERAKRALLGLAADMRRDGAMYMTDELLVTLGSSLLDLLQEVDYARAALRIGEPGDPGLTLRLELTPLPGTRLARVFPAEGDPTADWPYLAAVPAGAADFSVSRSAPGKDAMLELAVEFVARMFQMFESTALPELAAHVDAFGKATDDLLRQLDGTSLDASWAATDAERATPGPFGGDSDPFLSLVVGTLPRRTWILGVQDTAAAFEAARRACDEIQVLGPFLDEFFGGPLDVGCQREAGAVGDAEVDVMTLRERIEPGDLESGRRPYSADIYFAAANGRMVLVTGEGWQERIGWALADGAPQGGLAADPSWTQLRERAPRNAGALFWFDLAPMMQAVMPACGSASAPPVPFLGWSAMEDGRGVFVAESGEKLADQLAAFVASALQCGVTP